MSKKNSHRAERKRQRLNRLPQLAKSLIANRGAAQAFIASASFTRQLVAAGAPITPGFGVDEFNACVALVKDAIGVASLSDEEFEYALRLSIPPECRETSQ
jgi:hypothetical protein